MIDVVTLKAANGKRWANARMTRDFSAAAKRLVAAKTRYQAVEARTGVPWAIIAVIHERESSQNWSRSLAQGDPWDRVSIHVPAGRGPFESWEDAAIDALLNCAPHAARNKDWSIAAALTKLEEYNGLGYAARGKPSPYVWAGTNQYQSGKYVRDGVYDPNAVDRQPGCAGLLTAMMRLDPSIQFGAGVAPGASASKSSRRRSHWASRHRQVRRSAIHRADRSAHLSSRFSAPLSEGSDHVVIVLRRPVRRRVFGLSLFLGGDQDLDQFGDGLGRQASATRRAIRDQTQG